MAPQDGVPSPAHTATIELYLRPLITAFQARRDSGTLSDDDASLDELYTKLEMAQNKLGDAVMDATKGIFPSAELDEDAKARTGQILMEGGRAGIEAMVIFLKAILERFEGAEEQTVAIFKEIENIERRIEAWKGGGVGGEEGKIGYYEIQQGGKEENRW
jgi:hypothetical protein